MSSPTSAVPVDPSLPDGAQTPPPDSPSSGPVPRGWLILLAALVVAFVGSATVLVLVVSPPSYEPVPIPSVSRT